MWVHDRDSSPFSKPKQKWSEIILRGAADNEEFMDVHLTTLKSFYEETLDSIAMNTTLRLAENEDKMKRQLESVKDSIRNNDRVKVRQYAEHNKDDNMLTICIDVDKIDDNSINIALDALSELDFEEDKRMEFGEAKSFASEPKPFLEDFKRII